jgi:hypothetical protein
MKTTPRTLCFLVMDPARRFYWTGPGKGFRQLGTELAMGSFASFATRETATLKAAEVSAQIKLPLTAVRLGLP